MSAATRLPALDALKALACMLIIWHHLAFYGPMSDVVYPFAPALVSWLYDYGRMAVQVFLAVSGFLVAASLAPHGSAVFDAPGLLIFRRYLRLVRPYLVALAVSVLVAALVRPWLQHDSVPGAPGLLQLIAHVFLLQDVIGQEALSAGVWYVAIDFQLFAMTVLLLALARQFRRLTEWPVPLMVEGVAVVAVLGLASLFYFNRQSALDNTGLYFFGSYAFGMLAFWASSANGRRRWLWLFALAAMGVATLLLDFRMRLAVALMTAFVLVWISAVQPEGRFAQVLHKLGLVKLGMMSYSVFLIHFPVCLLVNAFVSHFWPTHLLANVLGLVAAFVLSLLAGMVLYRTVESRPLRLPLWMQWRRIPG